jgi:hypothetical protein
MPARVAEQVFVQQRGQAPAAKRRRHHDSVNIQKARVMPGEPAEVVVLVSRVVTHGQQKSDDLPLDATQHVVTGKPVESLQASDVHVAGVLHLSEIQRADGLEVAWRSLTNGNVLHGETSRIVCIRRNGSAALSPVAWLEIILAGEPSRKRVRARRGKAPPDL